MRLVSWDGLVRNPHATFYVNSTSMVAVLAFPQGDPSVRLEIEGWGKDGEGWGMRDGG